MTVFDEAAAGALTLLSRLLQLGQTTDAAVRAACVAIYTLCYRNHGCQSAAGTAQIIPRLMLLIGGHAGPLQDQTLIDCATALGVVCVGHQANQAEAHRHGAIETLVAIAAYGRAESARLRVCYALGCLCALLRHAEEAPQLQLEPVELEL